MSEHTVSGARWWSKAILIGAVIAALLLPVGALGSRFGMWTFGTGFSFLSAGVLLAAIGLLAGLVGIFVAKRKGFRADRPAIYLGTALSVLILAVMGLQFYKASSVPPIHNISTDLVDPPQFDRVASLRGEGTNPLAFNAEEIAPLQSEAYPWVETLESDLSPDAALARAREVLESMGLEIVNVDETAGRVEATDTTFWFGFKDDVVVRVMAGPRGSVVDMRSVSRVGRSDLGKNAERIGEFLEAFAEV